MKGKGGKLCIYRETGGHWIEERGVRSISKKELKATEATVIHPIDYTARSQAFGSLTQWTAFFLYAMRKALSKQA